MHPQTMKSLANATLGVGVLESDDIQADYERLSKAGIEFKSPPEEREYGGTDTGFKDDFGNYFSLRQREK